MIRLHESTWIIELLFFKNTIPCKHQSENECWCNIYAYSTIKEAGDEF